MTAPFGCRHDGTHDPAIALADTIREAVAQHAPQGTHAQSTGGVWLRGVFGTTPQTIATLSVRVGDWATSARAVIDGMDREGALTTMRARLRERLLRDHARHAAALRACETALSVLATTDGGAS